MPIAIVDFPGSMSRYIHEILLTWGVRQVGFVSPDAPLDAADVVIAPADLPEASHEAVLGHVRRGGRAIVMEPTGALAAAVGLTVGERQSQPLRLRLSGMAGSGLAGEALPVAGGAPWVEGVPFDDPRSLAGLYDPARIDGTQGECPGIIETALGDGRLISLGFDLPRSVMLLRQGDPDNAETRLHDATFHARTPKPSDMAIDIGPRDCGWLPFADLQSRLLVDLVDRLAPQPTVLVGHLPSEMPAIALYSGDEDAAPLDATADELDWLTRHDARMSLYIIPEETDSTARHGERYREHHDIAPHPNLIPVREAPVAERVREYERQIRLFNETFAMQARTVSNHVATWAGYLDLVYVQAKLGIRMDLNFFSGHGFREREHAPYSPFGAAMPMRFCEPNGALIDVYQQHRHLHDDLWFLPAGNYSYGYQPAAFERMLRRILDDACQRFHTPYVSNFHPENWVKFSRPFGQMVVEQATARGMGVWSFEQWLDFREAAERCSIASTEWDGATLTLEVRVDSPRGDLGLWAPANFADGRITTVTLDGQPVQPAWAMRYGRRVALIPVQAGRLEIRYQPG